MAGGGNNAIGSGAIVLTATADGLTSGLAKAGADVKAWGHTAGAELHSSLAGAGGPAGGLAGGFGGIGSSIMGVLGKIPGPAMVAGAALAGVGVAAHEVFGTLGDLAKTNKAADVLGVTASSYAGMQKVFERIGVEGNDITTIFAKMGKNILTSATAAEQFNAMGIDMKELRGADLAEQFKLIAEGFTKIPRGAQQASAALEIFGKSGAMLLPILQKGKEGINEWIEGESFEVLSDAQYKAAGDAMKAWKQAKKDIEGSWEGMVAHASVAFAPIVSFISKTISKVMNTLEPVFEWWSRAWAKIGDILEAVFTKLGEWFDDFGGWLRGVGEELDIFGSGWPTIEETIVAVFRAAGTAGSFAWDTIKSGAGAVAVVISGLIGAFDGLIVGFKEIVNLGKGMPNVLKPEWFDKFAAGVDRFESKVDRAAKRTNQWGMDAMQDWGKSAGRFNSWLDRALAPKPKAEKKLDMPEEAPVKPFEPIKFAGAVERGSKEDYSITMRAKYGEFQKPENDVNKENGKKLDNIYKVIKDQTEAQKEFWRKVEEDYYGG